jgi:putative transposase
MGVHRSGFYAWSNNLLSNRRKEDDRLLSLIKQLFQTSDRIYSSARIFCDLRELGETYGVHRVERIIRENKIVAQRVHRGHRHPYSKLARAAPNTLLRQFVTQEPDEVWVTDISYIQTLKGWLYLAVVLDLFSCKVICWSMKSTLAKEIVLDAILMAVWNRKPTRPVIIHSDRGSQCSSNEWQRFCQQHELQASISPEVFEETWRKQA